jgi:predicted protein tyrosine phosphatase
MSIGNPPTLFAPVRPGTKVQPLFRRTFERVLRLSFFDVDSIESLGRMRPKRVAELRDIERVVRFFEETRASTDGWTVHCWQGLSRSPAIALGLLHMIHGDEKAAAVELRRIRPEARPLQRVVGFFDEILGSNLSGVNDWIRAERIEDMKRELDLDADMLLEELPSVE